MTYEIAVSFLVLLIAVILLSTEIIRIDITAIFIMLVLPWTKVISLEEAFSVFSSNAVITVIAVMILGYGIENTGSLNYLADLITKKAGTEGRKVLAYSSFAVGLISSFMQNIGAVALFLPVIKKFGRRIYVDPKRLIMPMGFAGILGGTLSMIASSPLIVLNDLLMERGYQPLGFFSVTPIGAVLISAGILYFYFFWEAVLPREKEDEKLLKDELLNIYNLPKRVFEIEIPEDSPLNGKTIEELELWTKNKVHILALWDSGGKTYIPWRKSRFQEKQRIAVFGEDMYLEEFYREFALTPKSFLYYFHELNNEEVAGFAEIIIPPNSSVRGKTLEEVSIRKNFRIEPIVFISPEGEFIERMEEPLEAGLQIIIFGRWEDIKKIKDSREFIVISEVKPVRIESSKKKKASALISMGLAVLLVIFGFALPLSFFTGALLMLMLGVVPKEEVYKAVDWRTVFLLAGLIPLGIAFEKSGAAYMTAEYISVLVRFWNPVFILIVIGIMTALFSLFISNVAATVLLVPIVLIMSETFGLDPQALALFVAVSASNSFILPTHQVNAYIKGPGKYRNSDFLRAGGFMSLIFLIVSVMMIYIFYL